MSDSEDLLGDDLGDHSLADYNLGNDEEDQLLADDFEGGSTQNVPSSLESFREPEDMVPSDYSGHGMEYVPQAIAYQPILETECVVPNIVVEIPNLPPVHSTYAPYEPRHYEPEHSVPLAMPAVPIESPQIVPSEIVASIPNDMARERFITERPMGAQRLPQVRDIPDSLDKVVVAGGFAGRGRTWRSPHFNARYPQQHPYRRNNVQRGNFPQRNSFPPSQQKITPVPPPPEMPAIGLEYPPLQPPPMPGIELDYPPLKPPPMPLIPMSLSPNKVPGPFQPDMPLPMDIPRPRMDVPRPPMMELSRPPFQFQRFPFREERPMFNQMRPQFERQMYFPRQQFQRFGPPMPQVTIHQNLPDNKDPEIRMLPVPLPTSLPGGLAGKKVLINPHFKGTFQPPVEGPVRDIDDAAERFIAEQRNALARAAGRKFARRSPQRYIEDTTIEIENELARRPPRRRSDDDDLLRRQEEFIHANRAGLRRRMRSPSPPVVIRRSPSLSPRRSPDRERRARPTNDEDSEYKRRVREQESMRERVLRAKEVRRRKNAALYIKQMQEKDKDGKVKEQLKEASKDIPKPTADKTLEKPTEKLVEKTPATKPSEEETKPDTTKKTPERDLTPELESAKKTSPVKKNDEVNSTCEDLTPPPPAARVVTPPIASDDELELILGDIDGILSDDDDIITKKVEKPKPNKPEPPKPKPVTDLRSKLPPKPVEAKKPQRQKIIFSEEREGRKKKDKSPPRRAVVSSTKADDPDFADRKSTKTKQKHELTNKSRQRIIFENKDLHKPEKEKADKAAGFINRRVIIQRKATAAKDTKSVFSRIEITNDPSKPNPGIFSRAVRTIADRDKPEQGNRIVIKNEPEIEYDSSSDEEMLLHQEMGNVAMVDNLPHGMTDTRLNTLAGDVQSLILDKEKRTAKITFKTTSAAETFKKKFNNKMVAASRLTVNLQ